MHPSPINIQAIPPALPFSICTLVSDRSQYAAMGESFLAGGFGAGVAEYLYLDNSQGNRFDAYAGMAMLMGRATGRHVILCHQDVRLLTDGVDALVARLTELDALDPLWALAGNAGGLPDGTLAECISDPHGEDRRSQPLPARVESLDENFIVWRRESPIGLSTDIGGFDLYGADLCLHARMAGRTAWVMDFHLRHLSPGNKDAEFLHGQRRFEDRHARHFAKGLRIRTTCARLWVGGNAMERALARWAVARRLVRHARRAITTPGRGTA